MVGRVVTVGAKFAPPTFVANGLVRTKLQSDNNSYSDKSDDPSQYILEVSLSDNGSSRTATTTKVFGESVIVASGSSPRKLNLPNESILCGHSQHNCALCDGDAYAPRSSDNPKSVAVTAVKAISLLNRLGVTTIHWIHRHDEYKAIAIEAERIQHLSNAHTWTSYVVAKWVLKKDEDTDNYIPVVLNGVRIVGAKDGVANPVHLPCRTMDRS